MKTKQKIIARIFIPRVSYLVLLEVVVITFGVLGGSLLTAHFRPSQVTPFATGQQIEAARKAITARYLGQSTNCSGDSMSPQDRVATFYKYLRVNRYADRAVIRGCNNSDSLLAKVSNGTWQRTFVNVSLDLRANPSWQKACQIEDITVADTVVRSENRSIDDFNLDNCNYLAVHNEVKPWPTR